VNARLFWTSLAVQGVAVLALFGILAALFSRETFEDYGFVIGPIAWIGCSLLTARVMRLPLGYVAFAALAGGVAGVIVLLVASHWAGMAAALLVFAASCGSADPAAESA
jgi:hypothetical protein